MVKNFLTGLVLALGIAGGAAQAAPVTLADVGPDGPIGSVVAPVSFDVTVTGSAGVLDGFFQAPSAFTLAGANVLFPMGVITGTALSAPGTPQISFAAAGTPLLFGAFLDAEVDVTGGIARALFSNDGGTLSGDVNAYVIVTLTSVGAITNGTNSGTMTMAEASLAPIPLPAGAVLLIGGLGALVVTRRRKAA